MSETMTMAVIRVIDSINRDNGKIDAAMQVKSETRLAHAFLLSMPYGYAFVCGGKTTLIQHPETPCLNRLFAACIESLRLKAPVCMRVSRADIDETFDDRHIIAEDWLKSIRTATSKLEVERLGNRTPSNPIRKRNRETA